MKKDLVLRSGLASIVPVTKSQGAFVVSFQKNDKTCTITIWINGKQYRKDNLDRSKYDLIVEQLYLTREEPTKDNVGDLLALLENKVTIQKYSYLREENGQFFFGDIKVPMPDDMVWRFNEMLENGADIESLKKFWYKTCLNLENAKDLFAYCCRFGIQITSAGDMLMYKAVTHKKVTAFEKTLTDFVSYEWLKLKNQKKGTKNVGVYKNEKGEYIAKRGVYDKLGENLIEVNDEKDELIGNLDQLYYKIQDAEDVTIYTDKHTRKMNIRLGHWVTQDRSKCDHNIGNACSYGLHIGAYQYVKNFGSSTDSILLCIVNPMDVVALPEYDHSKIRTCAYLPIGLYNRNDQQLDWKPLDVSEMAVNYAERQKLVLEEAVERLNVDDLIFSEEGEKVKSKKTVFNNISKVLELD